VFMSRPPWRTPVARKPNANFRKRNRSKYYLIKTKLSLFATRLAHVTIERGPPENTRIFATSEVIMDKRLFIAFPVLAQPSLSSAIKRTRISAQKKEMEVNWVHEDNFHVTLFFLGNTNPSQIPEIEARIKEIASSMPPIKSSLRGMGGFPSERQSRVIWVG